MGNVGEAQAIESAAANLHTHSVLDLIVTIGGNEVVVTRIVPVPVAVLGAEKLGAPDAVGEGLQLVCGQAGNIAQSLEAEGAVEGGATVLVRGASRIGGQAVDPDDIEVISLTLAGETCAFNDVANSLLFANPEIDLTGGARIVHAGGDCYSLGEWVREVVLPREQAAVRHFKGGARLVARDSRVVGKDHVPLAAEVDPALRPEIAAAADRRGKATGLLASLEDARIGAVEGSSGGVGPGVGGGRRKIRRASPLHNGGVAGMVAGVGDAHARIIVTKENAGGVG